MASPVGFDPLGGIDFSRRESLLAQYLSGSLLNYFVVGIILFLWACVYDAFGK